MDKVCYECRHLHVIPEEPGWSEYTPGASAEITCNMGHWTVYLGAYVSERPTKKLRECIHIAQGCSDFESIPEDETDQRVEDEHNYQSSIEIHNTRDRTLDT